MRNEPMRRNDLPETCFSILPSSGQLIIIRCGERGYYPSEWDTGKREENREIASSFLLCYHRFQGGPGVFGTTESAKETQRTR